MSSGILALSFRHSQGQRLLRSVFPRPVVALQTHLWHRPLRRSASESGTLCHRGRGPRVGTRRQRALKLATLLLRHGLGLQAFTHEAFALVSLERLLGRLSVTRLHPLLLWCEPLVIGGMADRDGER